MSIKTIIPPMINIADKEQAGTGSFLCEICLAYHPAEFRSKKDYILNKYHYQVCQFAYDLIKKNTVTDDNVSSIYQAWNIDENAVDSKKVKESTPNEKEPLDFDYNAFQGVLEGF